ncbi:MAG: nucleotide sugar dehydrogenase, partial [Marinovum sp.]|nr:nucleotide sugar dehydrogenase [Marinovum sp.]
MTQRSVAVVGLGKIGLPLAVQYATRGHRVLGCDINPEVVELVNTGTEPFPGEDNLKTMLSNVVNNGSLQATTDTIEAVRQS